MAPRDKEYVEFRYKRIHALWEGVPWSPIYDRWAGGNGSPVKLFPHTWFLVQGFPEA